MEQLGSHWKGFYDTGHFDYFFRISVEKIQVSLKSEKKKMLLYMNTYVRLWRYLAHIFLEREIFHTKVVQKIKSRIYVQQRFPQNRAL
jgi:hypothetical protein